MGAMSRPPIDTTPRSSYRGAGVEYGFDRFTISREISRNAVTRLLTDRAEHGGWELDRVRLSPDGTRRVVLRRKIIRQQRLPYLVF
jgi:hypothetical protein